MPPTCRICNLEISRLSSSLNCSICFVCFHQTCLDISPETFIAYNKPSSNWICPDHSTIMPTPATSSRSTSSINNGNQIKKQLTLDDLAKLLNTLSSNQEKGFKHLIVVLMTLWCIFQN